MKEVVVGSFVPFPRTGEYARRVRIDELRLRWERILGKLREFLIKVRDLKGKEYLDPEETADAIVYFFKGAINRPLFDEVLFSPYAILITTLLEGPDYDLTKVLVAVEEEDKRELFNIVKSSIEDLDWALMNTPSDTRPLYNTSSLILHLLLTSAIASAKRSRENGILRLAALLHDIGKPFDYRNHVEEGVQRANQLLKDVIEDRFLKDVIFLIEKHHSKAYAKGLLKELIRADEDASARDRLSKIAEKIELRNIFREVAPYFDYEGSYVRGSWRPMEEAKIEDLLEVTERSIRKLSEMEFIEVDDDYDSDLSWYRIDIHGIQRFINESKDVKALQAASFLIDMLVIALIPWILRKFGIPPENIFASGGGFVEFIWRKGLSDEIQKIIINDVEKFYVGEDSEKYWTFNEIRLSVADVQLDQNFMKIRNKLLAKIALKKLNLGLIQRSYPLVEQDRCSVCGIRSPIKTYMGDKFCEICYSKHLFGYLHSFRMKWVMSVLGKSPANEIFNVSYENVAQKIMKVMTGVDPNETKSLNYAILKMDGNSVSRFMEKTLSVSDLFQRSFRIDRAMKLGVIEAFKKLGNDKDSIRFFLGTLYAGGDDALFLIPSRIAIHVARTIQQKFHSEMGGALTMGAGIASVPEKHSIWAAISAATVLLEEGKKEVFEGESGRRHKPGFVAFDYIDRGLLDENVALSRIESGRFHSFFYSHQRLNKLIGILNLNKVDTKKIKTFIMRVQTECEGLDPKHCLAKAFRIRNRSNLGANELQVVDRILVELAKGEDLLMDLYMLLKIEGGGEL